MEMKNKPIISLGFAQITLFEISLKLVNTYCYTALHPDIERPYPLFVDQCYG